MLNLLMNDQDNFASQLRRIKANDTAEHGSTAMPTELGDWMQYWNDAESAAVNLRKVQHWLQRARDTRDN